MHSARPRHRSTARTTCVDHRPASAPRHQGIDLYRPDERPLFRVRVQGWRHETAEVTYERRTLLFGGPIAFAVSGLASMAGNRRAQRAAERAAAAQWRPLGTLDVIATKHRLLVFLDGGWWSVWYSAVAQVLHSEDRLELHFAADAPYLLVGDVADVARLIGRAISVGDGVRSTHGGQ